MRISENFIKEKIGDDCVLVPIGEVYQNGVFELNETAERLFDLFSEGKNRDEAVTVLCNEYEGDAAEIAAWVDEYINKLLKAGILIDD